MVVAATGNLAYGLFCRCDWPPPGTLSWPIGTAKARTGRSMAPLASPFRISPAARAVPFAIVDKLDCRSASPVWKDMEADRRPFARIGALWASLLSWVGHWLDPGYSGLLPTMLAT